MTLTIAFNSASLGLQQAEKKIAVAASNINNADRAGYTRKSYQASYFNNGIASLPFAGRVVQSVLNPLLTKQVIMQAGVASSQTTLASYLGTYGQAFGSTADGANTLSNNFSTLTSALQILEANAGDQAAKSKVISTAQQLTATLNGLSDSVQKQRLQANNEIENSVTTINESLKAIYDLNRQISSDVTGSTADLEDQRNNALQALSQQIGIQYFINDQNQALVFSGGASCIVSNTQYATFSYSAAGSVNPGTLYPGGFSGILMNGSDITSSITTGKLGALVQLRDKTLVDEQSKLDALANTMQTTVNTVLNQGSAYPPLATISGTNTVTSATPFVGTGNLRIAVTDPTGVVVNYTDINLATLSPQTVGGLVTALNGVSGVTASIDANGHLNVSATSGSNRVAMNPMNSNVSGQSATMFFGFNNLFTNNTPYASSIQVNANLLSNYSGLAIGTLSSGALSAGSYGITSGDVSVATSLVNAMNSAQSFSAAGNFSARNSTLLNYANSIISDIATHASAAQGYAETAQATYTYLSDNLGNETGVNIDEESANLTVLQTAYQANAQIISTIRELYQTLIGVLS